MVLMLCLASSTAKAISTNSAEPVQHPEPLQLSDAMFNYSLGATLKWLIDDSGELQVGDLLASNLYHWLGGSTEIPNLGYTSSAVWFRTSVSNSSLQTLWYLVVDYPLIRNLEVYYVRNGSVDEVIHVGDQFEFAARPVENRMFILPVKLEYGERLDLYVRVTGPYSVQMPLYIMTGDVLLARESYSLLPHGLFFGFVLVMACYNFFLFLGTQEKAYFFYTLFTLSIGLFQFSQQGFAFQFLWPREVWWQNKSTGVFIHLSLISGYFFITSFLDVRRLFPKLSKPLRIIPLISLLVIFMVPWLDEYWVLLFSVVMALPSTIVAIASGWLVWLKKGRVDARYFSLAWGIFLVSILLLALNKLGVLPRNFITEHGAELGTVIELALLAFALASRINIERNHRLALQKRTHDLERAALSAKQKALDLEKMNSEQLEINVRERTRDLHRAMSELAVMNRRLEQMNLTDAVTGVGNENSFLHTLKKEWNRCCRSGEVLSLLVVELDDYRDIIAEHGKVASDECLKNVADILERSISRPADLITRYGDKIFGVVLPATDEMGARHLAEAVLLAVSKQPFDFGMGMVNASVSIGVASVFPHQPDQFKELLMAAEGAVYVAQTNGGNRVQCTMTNA